MNRIIYFIIFVYTILIGNGMCVTFQWDPQDDCDGFYLYWYLPDETPKNRVKISSGQATTGDIPDSNFQQSVIYNIHATAWANPINLGDPELESEKSNIVQYRHNPIGGNNKIAPNEPTNLILSGSNFTWNAPETDPQKPNPVGYHLYYKESDSSTWSGPILVMGTTQISINDVNSNWTKGVSYHIKVNAFVYGIDGIAELESGNSNIFVFTPSGSTGKVPSAPKGLQIKK